MVAPIREIGNKLFLSSAITTSTTNMTLLTVNTSTYMEMDFENAIRNTSNNYDEVRDRTSTSNKHSSRDSLVSLTVSSVAYSKWMEMNNNIDGDVIMDAANSPQLSYTTLKEQNNHVSKAADLKNNTMEQCVLIKGLALNALSTSKLSCVDDDDNIINI